MKPLKKQERDKKKLPSLNTREKWLKEEKSLRRDSNTYGPLAQLESPSSMLLHQTNKPVNNLLQTCFPRLSLLTLNNKMSTSKESSSVSQNTSMVSMKWHLVIPKQEKNNIESLVSPMMIELLNLLRR